MEGDNEDIVTQILDLIQLDNESFDPYDKNPEEFTPGTILIILFSRSIVETFCETYSTNNQLNTRLRNRIYINEVLNILSNVPTR